MFIDIGQKSTTQVGENKHSDDGCGAGTLMASGGGGEVIGVLGKPGTSGTSRQSDETQRIHTTKSTAGKQRATREQDTTPGKTTTI